MYCEFTFGNVFMIFAMPGMLLKLVAVLQTVASLPGLATRGDRHLPSCFGSLFALILKLNLM